MLMKRIYKENGALDYIALAHTGATAKQNFSTNFVTECLAAGIMEIVDDELILRVSPEDLRYVIKRLPGRYCLHCGEKLPDDIGGQLARLHIAMRHTGMASPSASDPAGYETLNYFECVLNDAQHEEYRVKQPARAPHFHIKE